MAIKGKGKTRGRRAPAPAPRPVLVVRKPPLFRRRSVWAVVGTVVVLAVATVAFIAVRSHSRSALESRERAAVSQLTSQLENALPTQVSSVGGSTVFTFPSFPTELQNLQKGQTKPADSLATEKDYAAAASKAVTDIGAIRITSLFPEDFTVGGIGLRGKGLMRAELLDSQFLLVQGFKAYQDAFALWTRATGTTGAEQKALIERATSIGARAQDLFSQGWTKFVQIRAQLGLSPLTLAPGPTAPPPGQAPQPTPSP